MKGTSTIKEKGVDVATLELPYEDIRWDWDGDIPFYRNNEHTIYTDEYMLVFELSIRSKAGADVNDVHVGKIHQVWIGEDLEILSQEQEDVLRKRLEKHYSDPLNAN